MPKFVSEDGRQFTDYTPSCSLNASLQEKYKVSNSHEYRYYLQHNAEQIMKDLANCKDETSKACPVCKIELKPTGPQ